MRNLDRARILLVALMLALPLSVMNCAKTITETLDDTTITTRVKTSLLNDPNVGGLRIDVDTFKSVVTLTGRVRSADEREQAIALARRVQGVSEVKDSLEVVAADATAPVSPATASPTPAGRGGPALAREP